MSRTFVEEENTVYEVDELCMLDLKKKKEEKNREEELKKKNSGEPLRPSGMERKDQ